MKLSETSIRRPVLASMFSAALVLFGAIGYTRLSVRELPDIDPPIISVSTALPGANAQVVETAVTDVLEEELSTIQGLRTLSSSSSEENSQIILEFNLDRAVDVAAQDVRDKVSRVRGRLPVDVLEPVIAKQQADAQPFFWLALSSAPSCWSGWSVPTPSVMPRWKTRCCAAAATCAIPAGPSVR